MLGVFKWPTCRNKQDYIAKEKIYRKLAIFLAVLSATQKVNGALWVTSENPIPFLRVWLVQVFYYMTRN